MEEDARVNGQMPEVFQWLLVPVQSKPDDDVKWEAFRLTGAGELAARTGKKLKREDLLVGRYASTWLQKDLDRIPLWQDHVEVRQLADHYARYTYLQRVEDPSVIVESVREGVGLLTWETETFAYAEGYDQEEGRYLGLRAGTMPPAFTADDPGLVVRPEVARKQIDKEAPRMYLRAPAQGQEPARELGPVRRPAAGPGTERARRFRLVQSASMGASISIPCELARLSV